MILFVHGLNTSGQCDKCQLLKKYAKHASIPSLDLLNVEQSLETLRANITDEIEIIIGASLGGFYAHYLAKKYDKELLLINPIINPLNFINAVDLGNLDKNALVVEIQRLLSFNNSHDFYQAVEVLFGLDDEIIPFNQARDYFANYSCKYYKDDHRLLKGFEDYLLQKKTLLSQYL